MVGNLVSLGCAVWQVEQGLGLGSTSPIFNRHVASITRFIKLRNPASGSSSPPPVLVTHARCETPPSPPPSYRLTVSFAEAHS